MCTTMYLLSLLLTTPGCVVRSTCVPPVVHTQSDTSISIFEFTRYHKLLGEFVCICNSQDFYLRCVLGVPFKVCAMKLLSCLFLSFCLLIFFVLVRVLPLVVLLVSL